jgi:hypothetical protein
MPKRYAREFRRTVCVRLVVIPVSVVDETLERGEAADGRMGSIAIVGVDPGPKGC